MKTYHFAGRRKDVLSERIPHFLLVLRFDDTPRPDLLVEECLFVGGVRPWWNNRAGTYCPTSRRVNPL